eukprot:Colp12_sorted_trinity150504_noHs@2579
MATIRNSVAVSARSMFTHGRALYSIDMKQTRRLQTECNRIQFNSLLKAHTLLPCQRSLVRHLSTQPKPTTLLDKVKNAAMFVWQGARNLGRDTIHHFELQLGENRLTWRESRLVKRNRSDLKALVPFLVIASLPGSMVLFPIMLRLFPSSLPPTFQDEEFKKKRTVQMTLARWELLPAVLAEIDELIESLERSSRQQNQKAASLLRRHFKHADRESCLLKGQVGHASESFKEIAQLLGDEVNWDSLTRRQVKLFCRYMTTSPFASKGKLDAHMKHLREDDLLLVDERADTLSHTEVVEALLERGVSVVSLTDAALRDELMQWRLLALSEPHPPPLVLVIYAVYLSSVRTAEKPKADE